MPYFKDDAIILKTQKLAETDRIITALTENYGKVQAVAKGVRRTKSRYGASLEPFMRVELQVALSRHPGKTLHTVAQTEIIAAYGPTIAADYDKYSAASLMAEVADKLLPELEVPSTQLFKLLARALKALVDSSIAPDLIAGSFLLRAMSGAGWEFDITSEKLLPSVSILLEALMAGDWTTVEATIAKTPESHQDAITRIIRHTTTHLERRLNAYSL